MKNKIFSLFLGLFFSFNISAQNIAPPEVNTVDVFPCATFDTYYSEWSVFRNKFNKVLCGTDTVWYFVDINGMRAFMAQGAPTDSGGVVNTLYPIVGDGGSTNPVRLTDGVHPGDILAWDSVPGAWIIYPFPINIYTGNGGLTANRTVTGNAKSLTYTGLTSHSESGSGDNTTTTTGIGDIVESSARDVNVSAGGDVSISAADAVGILSNGSLIDLSAETNVQMSTVSGNISGTSAQNVTFSADGGDVGLFADQGLSLSFGLGGGLSNGIVTDGALSPLGLVDAATYCNPNEDLQLAEIGCVKGLIHDSISGLGLPPGTINQTLRYSGTNILQANSQIYNDGSRVAIGTTTLPSRYELYVLGSLRANQKAGFGNAVSVYQPRATLYTNDSTAATPSIVAFSNNANSINSDMRLVLRSRHFSAHSLLQFLNESAGESSYKIGYGSGFTSLRFCANSDTSINNGLAMSIGTLKHIGVWVDGKVDGQMNFQAQTDEGTIPPPIALTPGATPDTKVDGTIYYNDDTVIDNLNFVVGTEPYILAKCHTGNATIDFGALGVLGTESQPVTVTGALQGDQCIVSDNLTHVDGVIYTCAITGADTARVTVLNATIAGVNPASSDFKVRAFH